MRELIMKNEASTRNNKIVVLKAINLGKPLIENNILSGMELNTPSIRKMEV